MESLTLRESIIFDRIEKGWQDKRIAREFNTTKRKIKVEIQGLKTKLVN